MSFSICGRKKNSHKKCVKHTFSIEKILALIGLGLMEAIKPKQESMNRSLCKFIIRMREYTGCCIAFGGKYGRLEDLPFPKGCIYSYAPEWTATGIRLRERRKGYSKPKQGNKMYAPS